LRTTFLCADSDWYSRFKSLLNDDLHPGEQKNTVPPLAAVL